MNLRALFAAGALALIAAPAFASDLPAGGLTREDVLKWLQGKGYTAEIKYDTTAKDNYVSTSSDGVNWSIYFFACSNDTSRCASIQYSAGWDDTNLSDATVITWNRVKRFIRAYKTANKALFGEYDIDVSPGGTWESLDYTLTRWKSALANFKEMIDKGDSWADGR